MPASSTGPMSSPREHRRKASTSRPTSTSPRRIRPSSPRTRQTQPGPTRSSNSCSARRARRSCNVTGSLHRETAHPLRRGGPHRSEMTRRADDELLLGEWACLGILYAGPSHGFAIASRLKPSGDIGRVWSLTRPLTYRALEQLEARGYVHPVGEEPGIAGGNRTILAATRLGRSRLRSWVRTPVGHLRD